MVADTVLALVGGVLTADWTLLGIAKGAIGGLVAVLIWEWIGRPLRHYIWTVPMHLHLKTLREKDEQVRLREQAQRDRERLTEQLAAITTTGPRFVCTAQKWVPLHSGDKYLFHALSVWIVNQPPALSERTSAKNVSVRIEFYALGASEPCIALTSQWTQTHDPEAAGFAGFQPTTDIAANDVPAKFLLVIQHPETDDDCYAFSKSVLLGQADGRHESYRIRPGLYLLRILLKGDNVAQTVEMGFTHYGKQQPPELSDAKKIGAHWPPATVPPSSVPDAASSSGTVKT
jgi:hypothetical protein